jgi:hypothetical protein
MYFNGGQYNDNDSWLNSASRKDLLIVDPTKNADGSQTATFDIVMMRA